MKIVNRRKFLITISISVLVLLFIVMAFINKTYSKVELENKELFISSGDTLWSIAQEELNNNKYFENMDIREVVSIIKRANNLQNVDLKEGNKILIPKYKCY